MNWIGNYPDVIELYNPSELSPYTPNPKYADDTVPTIGVNTFAQSNSLSSKNSTTSQSDASLSSKNNSNTTSISTKSSCWSEKQGYKCCKGCEILYEDEDGPWGVEDNEWCGIINDCHDQAFVDGCFATDLGYPCCDNCKSFYYEDDDGKWGIENNEWCGLKFDC